MVNTICKAKRIDNGQWIQGFLINEVFGAKHPVIIYDVSYNDGNQLDYEWEFVDGDTVCQFTGLVDMNKQLVFTNDIIMLGFDPFVVRYDLEDAKYRFYSSMGSKRDGFNIDTLQMKQVVGNIFDNPELLGGTKND